MGALSWTMLYAMASDDALPAFRSQQAKQHTVSSPSPLSDDDFEIVTSIRAGNVEAFRTLYLRTHSALIGFATALTPSRADAEEAVQDVFASLWERRTQWSPARSIAAYLFAAVRNRTAKLRAHRTIVVNATRDADVIAARSAGQPPDRPDTAAEADDLRHAVARAIAALPERRRLALTLRFGQALSYAEIGEILGTSEHAATLLVTRARDTIAPLLTPFRPP